MKTLTIEIKFYEPDALGEALQDIIDQLGQGSTGGEITLKQELPYVYIWSIKKWKHIEFMVNTSRKSI